LTCCIGIHTPEGILIAADTCIQASNMIYERAPKIFRAKRGLLATAGSAGATDLIADEWMKSTGSLDAIQKLLRADLKTRPDGIDATFLWAGSAGLRALDGCGSVSRSKFSYCAVGSGEEIAIGYLGASKLVRTLDDAESLAKRTLSFVSQCVCNVRPPFQVEVWRPGRRQS